MTKKSRIGLAVAGGLIVILAAIGVTLYNGLVRTREAVDGGWAQVQSMLQRRADLIPNLVETVKGEDHRGHAHPAERIHSPLDIGESLQPSQVHGPSSCRLVWQLSCPSPTGTQLASAHVRETRSTDREGEGDQPVDAVPLRRLPSRP